MVLQPFKIYRLKLRNKTEFTGQAIAFKMHSTIFKDESNKKIEIKNSDILSHKVIKDLTDTPVKQQDRDPGIGDRKGPMKATYQRPELF